MRVGIKMFESWWLLYYRNKKSVTNENEKHMLESSLKPEQNKLVSVTAMAWCGIKWLPVVKCQVTGSPTGATQELCPKYRI